MKFPCVHRTYDDVRCTKSTKSVRLHDGSTIAFDLKILVFLILDFVLSKPRNIIIPKCHNIVMP